jgi:hypothetical protein
VHFFAGCACDVTYMLTVKFGRCCAGFLHMVFPDALILHTMRDPLDTLFRYR